MTPPDKARLPATKYVKEAIASSMEKRHTPGVAFRNVRDWSDVTYFGAGSRALSGGVLHTTFDSFLVDLFYHYCYIIHKHV